MPASFTLHLITTQALLHLHSSVSPCNLAKAAVSLLGQHGKIQVDQSTLATIKAFIALQTDHQPSDDIRNAAVLQPPPDLTYPNVLLPIHRHSPVAIASPFSNPTFAQDLPESAASQIDQSRRLPPEILSDIFHRSLPVDRSGNFGQYFQQLIQVTHVSMYWRSVGLQTAELWSQIQFFISDAREIEVAQAWLHRSQNQPISFRLWDYLSFGDISPTWQNAMNVLVPHCARWRDATLGLPNVVPSEIISQITDSVPLLESLTIISSSHHGIPSMFSLAPQLRNLTIDRVEGFLICPVPWYQLTTLVITFGIKSNDCLEVLRQSPNLATLKFAFFSSFNPALLRLPDVPHVKHALLTNLDIARGTDVELNHFFDHVSFPRLAHFIYQGKNWRGHLKIASMLSRSSEKSPLTRLILDMSLFDCDYNHLSQLLNETPRVVDLELTGFEDDPDNIDGEAFINTLIAEDDIGLLPKLQCLTYHPKYTIGEGMALLEMIESRRREKCKGSAHCLRCVNVDVVDPTDLQLTAPVLFKLRQFAAEGLLRVRGCNEEGELRVHDLLHLQHYDEGMASSSWRSLITSAFSFASVVFSGSNN